MVEVYIHAPSALAANAVACGIKLSEWYSREMVFDGDSKKIITGFLNPRDDQEKYMAPGLTCLKLKVLTKYCLVADRFLYEVGQVCPQVMELYKNSILPIEKYTLGDYRLPECLLSCSVMGEYVSEYGKKLDSPILYENSRELYFSRLFNDFRENHRNFDDALLYYFFKKLNTEGKVSCNEDESKGLAVFRNYSDGKTFTLRIPDMSGY